MQRDRVVAIGTDARRILAQHRLGEIVALQAERRDEIDPRAGVDQKRGHALRRRSPARR